MAFSSILGQDKTVERLRSLVLTGRVPPALLFYGPPGVGKFKAALEFACALNCTRVPYTEKAARDIPDEETLGGLFGAAPETPAPAPEPPRAAPVVTAPGEACGVCLSCLQAKSGAHPDIRIVDTVFQAALLDEDESANLKIDTVRELTRWAHQKPMLSAWKLFIVRDAEALVPQAQNALLKTLEDPPPGTVVLLTASQKNALLPTILSRSCPVEFSPLPRAVVKRLLEEQGIQAPESARLAALSRGSLEKAGEARSFLERAAKLRPGDQSRAFKFAAGLPRDNHSAREEVKTLLDLILERQRAAWSTSTAAPNPYTGLIRRTLELRRMVDRNVSFVKLLETALLESEKAGLRLEELLGETRI